MPVPVLSKGISSLLQGFKLIAIWYLAYSMKKTKLKPKNIVPILHRQDLKTLIYSG